jgi:general secretion pathway protein E
VSEQDLRLPYGFARRHGVAITSSASGHARAVYLATAAGPVLVEVRRFAGRPVEWVTIEPDAFERLLPRLYESARDATQLSGDLEDNLALADLAEQLPSTKDLLESSDEAPIIRFLNAMLSEAIRENASDIHIEPFEGYLAVRFRVDGMLREVLRPNRALAAAIASRVKVMARLDIAEKRLPQDGRISLRVGGRPVDVRVSTLPASHGERVVLRLLDKQAGRLDTAHLGLGPAERRDLEGLVARPHGIVLVTGPTGSGKTTTLYALLSALNTGRYNIITVEDPIEYHLEGIGQTQVNLKAGLDFARGLRAILRQDPDIVMVGEIRDRETADTAVQASLTGHLVLSTLHTNTAVGALTRLRDMGVEPFLLASSLSGVVAQRLVRRLCPDCKEPRPASDGERAALGVPAGVARPTLHHPVGCPACRQQGYRGRFGVFEVVTLDEAMRERISQGAAEQELTALARRTSAGIIDNARAAVLAGDTTVEEALRVIRGD